MADHIAFTLDEELVAHTNFFAHYDLHHCTRQGLSGIAPAHRPLALGLISGELLL